MRERSHDDTVGLSRDPGALGRVGVFSFGIARIPDLKAFLGADELALWPLARSVDHLVGWGQKPNTRLPRALGEHRDVPFVALEDGFLRSVGLGVRGAAPHALVVDPVGIYYDATRPSRLEAMLAREDEDDPLRDEALLGRARAAIARIRRERLSKYNDAPVRSLGAKRRPRVLVVDQTAGDLSIRLGACVEGGFEAMLRAARAENPDAEIVIKTHPDVALSKKVGHLDGSGGPARLLSEPCNPIALLEEVDRVYVMTSLLGFEALMVGKPVSCFGAPFYAGWGLTDDRATVPARRARTRTLFEVFAAAYLLYSRYVDPETGERCELERIIDHLALQRRVGERNARTMVCVGFSTWKRGFLPSFLRGPGNRVIFADGAVEIAARIDPSDDAVVVVWGTREDEAATTAAADASAPIWRMEDGFLRSVGLGSDLYAPASLVLDPLGIYYDPQRPSELERILAEERFDEDELARARALRELVVASKISKYNVGVRRHVGPRAGDARQVVLAIGQVEDDASIQRGCLDVSKNEELVRAARIARPHAYLVYKPHPDVVSGNRQDSLPLDVARKLCDEVVVDATLPDCLAVASEVHTMTSLVGFEALLRELRVVAYGQPFYAGWGLTEDRHPHPRRTRRLSLDELVLGTLLSYPRYVHPRSGQYSTPEAIVEYLRTAPRPPGWETTWAGRQVRKAVNIAREVVRAR